MELDKKNRGYVDIVTWIDWKPNHDGVRCGHHAVQNDVTLEVCFGLFSYTIETKHSERLVAFVKDEYAFCNVDCLGLGYGTRGLIEAASRPFSIPLGSPVIKSMSEEKKKKRFGKRGKKRPLHILIITRKRILKRVIFMGWVDPTDIPEYKLRIHTENDIWIVYKVETWRFQRHEERISVQISILKRRERRNSNF